MPINAESFRKAADLVIDAHPAQSEEFIDAVVSAAAVLVETAGIDIANISDSAITELLSSVVGDDVDPGMIDAVRTGFKAYETFETERYSKLPFEAMSAMFYRDRDKQLMVRLEVGDQQIRLLVDAPPVREMAFDMQTMVKLSAEKGETEKRYS